MIRGLMNPDPTKRMTMNQALSHPWTVGEPGDGADFIMSSASATAQPPANPANHAPDAGVNASGANASGANANADVGAGSTPVVVTDNALPPRGEGPMTKRMSPVSAMELSSQGSRTTGSGLASLAEHSADGSSSGSEPTSPHSLAASSDTEGAEGSPRGTPQGSVQGEGSYDIAGRDSTDRSSTASTISISVSDMQRVSTSSVTSSMHGSIVEAQTSNKQLAVTELESSEIDDCTKTYGPEECAISYTCPILAFQQRIYDLFRVSLRLPAGSTETRAKLVEGANVAKVAAVENIAQIRKLHNLTKDIRSGIDDLVLAAEVEEPGLAHDVLNQHRRMVEDLQDQRRVVHEMNVKLAQIVHSIVAASATDHLTVDTATETVAGSPTSRDVQLDADLAMLVKDVKALKSPSSRRATLSPEGILMPPAAMAAIEKAESDDGTEGQGAGGGLDADGGQIVTTQEAGGGGGGGGGRGGGGGGRGGASGGGGRELSTGGELALLQLMMDEIDNHLALIDSHHAKFEQGFDKMTHSGDGIKRLVDYTGKVKIMARYRERLEAYGAFWKCVSTRISNGLDAYDAHVNQVNRPACER